MEKGSIKYRSSKNLFAFTPRLILGQEVENTYIDYNSKRLWSTLVKSVTMLNVTCNWCNNEKVYYQSMKSKTKSSE